MKFVAISTLTAVALTSAFVGFLTPNSFAHSSPQLTALPRFVCHLDDIQGEKEQFASQDFEREVSPCVGTCLVPIDHLQTPYTCRDFIASVDASRADQEEPSMDVTLWAYCGAAPIAGQGKSQTVTLPLASRHFEMLAEWDGWITHLRCDRKKELSP
jgi:hypothetical protein